MDKSSVLLVEDNPDLREIVETNVRALGLKIESVEDGETGLERALTGKYSLLLLDIMLPNIDGLTLCRKLREAEVTTPIIMLTARGDELTKVLGLEYGADDYVVKPFSEMELRARITAMLRRAKLNSNSVEASADGVNELSFGELNINLMKKKVAINGSAVTLTALEFDLLAFLAQHPGVPFSRQELLEKVWGYSAESYENNVNAHINRIRNKIESDPSVPKYLLTVRGVGYCFADLNSNS